MIRDAQRLTAALVPHLVTQYQVYLHKRAIAYPRGSRKIILGSAATGADRDTGGYAVHELLSE